jgi:hypothetical protein
MRSLRSALAVCVLLLAVPSWGKQPPQSPSTTQPASDPQAVAVVQAAITALGGAVTISQVQSWTLQASVQGPTANGEVSYTMSTVPDTSWYVVSANGTTKPAPGIRSLFVPVAVGSVLTTESQDPRFLLKYRTSTSLGSKTVAVIDFYVPGVPFVAQVWCFDTSSNLPVSINFRLPAELGERISPQGVVNLSGYQTVSGVLYPFLLSVSIEHAHLPEVITIQAVTPSSSVLHGDYNSSAGDVSK